MFGACGRRDNPYTEYREVVSMTAGKETLMTAPFSCFSLFFFVSYVEESPLTRGSQSRTHRSLQPTPIHAWHFDIAHKIQPSVDRLFSSKCAYTR